ncbi:MAG: prepilin-type N-terminal cleavage/methylation domain-containing protein [Patescibacteria group bacterium]
MTLFNFKNSKGFTLVETMVAIAILSVSITATFTAAQKGLQSSSYAKDQITAFYLIQDAMEYIENVRDINRIQSIASLSSGGSRVGWLTGLSQNSSDPCWFADQPGGKVCTIDTRLNIAAATAAGLTQACTGTWASNTCSNVYQDTATASPTYLYGYTTTAGWTQTSFKREIKFETVSLSNPPEVRVTVRVSWASGVFAKSISVSEDLLDR